MSHLRIQSMQTVFIGTLSCISANKISDTAYISGFKVWECVTQVQFSYSKYKLTHVVWNEKDDEFPQFNVCTGQKEFGRKIINAS